jgi:hypothetical protein
MCLAAAFAEKDDLDGFEENSNPKEEEYEGIITVKLTHSTAPSPPFKAE